MCLMTWRALSISPYPQGPLPVRHARQDGEEKVPLHSQGDVLARARLPPVIARRALGQERLHQDAAAEVETESKA
jgi:hypothetical protein